MTPQSLQKEIKSITRQIREKYKPEKIILFGSHAYGRPTDSSDIDMLVVKKTPKSRIERIKDVLFFVDYNIPFEPIVYTPAEIRKRLEMGDYFIEEIIKKGEVLYDR